MATIAKPLMAGVNISYDVRNEGSIDFLFSEGDASFNQHGNSLVISFNDGSTIVLHNFFFSQASIGFSDGNSYTTDSFVQSAFHNSIQASTTYLEEESLYTPPSAQTEYFNSSTGTTMPYQALQGNPLDINTAAGPNTQARQYTNTLDDIMDMANTKTSFATQNTADVEYLQGKEHSTKLQPQQDMFQEVTSNYIDQGSHFVEVMGQMPQSYAYPTQQYYATPPQQAIQSNPYMNMAQPRIRQGVIQYGNKKGYYTEDEYIENPNTYDEYILEINTNAGGTHQSGGVGEYRELNSSYDIEYTEALGLANSEFTVQGIGGSREFNALSPYTAQRTIKTLDSSDSSVTPPTPPQPITASPTISMKHNTQDGAWDNAKSSDTLLSDVKITTDGGIKNATLTIDMQQGDSLTLPDGTVLSGQSSGSVVINGLTISYTIDANLKLTLTISSSNGICDTTQLQEVLNQLKYWNSEFGSNPSIDTGNREGSLTLTQQDEQSVNSSLGISYREKISGNFTSETTSKSYYYQGSDASEKVDLSASSGSNLIVGGAGNNTIIGGSGADIIIVGGSTNGNNPPTIDNPLATGHSSVEGGLGNDTIIGSAGANTIHGGEGNDLIFGGAIGIGADNKPLYNTTVSGTSASNKLVGGNGNDTIIAGSGGDLIYGSQESVTTSTTTGGGNNLIYTGSGNDTIHAGGGNNTIHATSGNNKIYTGAGNDHIIVSGGTNTIHTGNGQDSIEVQAGNNTILAENGNNTIVANSGSQHITTGDGSDSIQIHGGSATINAGAGDNTLHIEGGSTDITTTYGNDAISISGGHHTINTGAGNDTISITNGSGSLNTGAGNNIINISGGSMNVTSEHGNDIFNISGGSSHIVTGSGSDKVIVSGNFTGNIQFSSNSNDVLSITGTTNLDNFTVSEAEALYYGGSGNHTVSASTLASLAGQGDNFVTIKTGGTVLNTQQIVVSGDANYQGVINVTGLTGKAAILGTTTINGQKVYAVTFNKDSVILVPEHFADNLAFNGQTVHDMVGKLQTDTSKYTNISTGSASLDGLSNALSGQESTSSHNRSSEQHDEENVVTPSENNTHDTIEDSELEELTTPLEENTLLSLVEQERVQETEATHHEHIQEENQQSLGQEVQAEDLVQSKPTIPTAPAQEGTKEVQNTTQEQSEEETILDFSNIEQQPTETTPISETTLSLDEVLLTQTQEQHSQETENIDSVALFKSPTPEATHTDIQSVSIEKSFGDMLTEVQLHTETNTNGLS